MNARIERIRARRTVSPRAHEIVSWFALTFLTLIVVTGTGVRLTGSGLGCSNWPKCTEESLTPVEVDGHAYIEYGNRLMTTPVLLFCVLALLFALLRNPYRPDFTRIAGAMVIGVLAQAVLGGITVLTGLDPLIVSGHFLLSMVTLTLAVALVWRVRRDRSGKTERAPIGGDLRAAVWVMGALGAAVVFIGTMVTAAGPHSGGEGTGDEVRRLDVFGPRTFVDMITVHARIALVFGILTIAVFVFAAVRRAGGVLLAPLTTVAVMTGLAGLVGHLQYHVYAYPEGLVWVHVIIVALLWCAISWAVIATGIGKSAQVPGIDEPKQPQNEPHLVAS